ncbi:MAG: transcriptional regulator, partial [Acidobacteriaceae bacterium]
AYGCLDWSERRPHLGGALGAAVLTLTLRNKWFTRELDSRALSLTRSGRRELEARFGIAM